MNKNKKIHLPSVVGGSSLLVIFAVLCLAVFSILTISTAKAQEHFCTVSADSVKAYYEADSKAELIFSQLRKGHIPEGVEQNNNIYSYSCEISDTLFLEVELSFSNGVWDILRWESVSTNI